LENFGSLILDILGEIAGGRGGAINDLSRFTLGMIIFTLGMIIWSVLIVSAFHARRRNALLRDKLLVAGFVAGFSREFFMLVVAILGITNVVSANTLSMFFPPIDHMLSLLAQSVIAAAFLHYLVKPKEVSKSFFVVTVSICCLMYFFLAPWWWETVKTNPEAVFEKCWGAWGAHGFGAAFNLVAIIIFLQERNWVRYIVAIAFTMYFGNHFLALVDLATVYNWQSVFTPIRNNLDLWATPLFAYIYWREQRDKHDQLQAELKQTERLELVGQLAAGVSHDFKNHLQVIMGYGNNPEKVSDCLTEISDTVERSSSLVNQLLVFSRREQIPGSASVNINDVVSELTPMLSQLLGPKYRLDFQLQPDIPVARFDTTELEQIIVNLIVNARDAQPDGGVIRLATRFDETINAELGKGKVNKEDSDEPSIDLLISDLGHGMSVDTVKHAFDPFYTTKPVGEGTGLGLSTVYGLVSKHRGQVNINSAPGKGTTVAITLRPAKNQSADVVQKVSEKVAGGRETVLLAEDDDSVRNLTTELLTQSGYTVYAAIDGSHAIELAKRYRARIDLLLFDVAMPKLNGYLTYEQIVKIMPGVPVAFVTADASRAKAKRSNHAHLAKPYTRDQLLNFIKKQLKESTLSAPMSSRKFILSMTI